MGINLTQKSSRLLQSRRYTTDALDSSQEAFTRVLDLGTSEIYSETNLIPTASLPFSGIGNDQQTSGVIKYWYRFQMTPDSSRQVWMFIDPPQAASGIQLLNPNQLTNFISPKYIRADLGDNNAELTTGTGYKVVVSLGSDRVGATPITDEKSYAFDYKTGVLQFASTPSAGNIYITTYQYIGRTLADNDILGYSGSFSGSFQGDGAGLTNIPASGIVGLNLTQIATNNVTASVSEGGTSFQLTNTGTPLLTVGNTGTITAAGSASFKDTTITGSLLVTQNLRVLGTASFTSVTSSQINVGASIITLSTDDPVVRFGGMVVRDSGSFGLNSTASFLYDSEKNQWLFQHEGVGEQTGSSIAIFGPLNEGNLGDEQGLAEYTIPRTYTNHGHHIGNSNIFSTGSSLTINKGVTGSINGVEILGDLEVTGSLRVTAGASGSFSGSFQGNGAGLTNLPASSIVGLNLTQIADNYVSASVSSVGTPFTVSSAGSPLFKVDGTGGITTFSTSSLKDIQVTGSATISDNLISETSLTVSGSTILSGSSTIEGFNIITGTTEISGSTTISGSVVIISDSEVTGSVNVSGSTNTIGTSTVIGEMIITGSLTVSGSSTLTNVGPAEFSGSTGILGTLNVSGTSSTIGTALVTGSAIISGSVNIQGPTSIVGITLITGSTLLPASPAIAGTSLAVNGDYALSVSQSAWFYNHNAGVPRSNAWKSGLNGSYFNQFDSNTNVSEILRFIAGLLSASAPDASPNTKYYNSINNNSPSLTIGSIDGYVPQDISGSDLIYLNSKGFANTGSTIFSGVGTVYRTLNPTYSFTSVADGSTTVSSSADAQLFNLGEKGVIFNVSGTLNWRFDDNFSQTVTETSQSQAFTSRSTFGSSNPGLTVGEINTVNPLVIPNAYQDGKFQSIFNMTFYNGGRSLTSVSSSGWYHVSASIGIQSGSSVYSGFKNNFTKVFAAPTSNIVIPTQTITFTQSVTPETATSRSLSGAPYLQTSTWTYSITSSGVFEPLYYGNSTIFSISDNSSLVNPTAGTATQVMSGGTISGTSLVYDSTGVTQKTGIPFRTDRIQTTLTETFTAGAADENINETGLGTSTYTITSTSYNRSGGTSTTSSLIPFHQAGTFGQPLSSGSMAYNGRAQGNDPGTLTGNSETFLGETYRLKIDNALLTGSYQNGTKFTTGSYDAYNLGALDLQVKPGYLIRPGSPNYKYWLTDPDSTKNYKFYARSFRVTTPYSSLYIDIGKTLNNWTSTSDGASVAIVFNSVFANGNLSGTFGNSNPILFDVASILSTGIEANNQATDNFINPFSVNINVYGNVGGNISNTKYGIGLDSNTLKQVLNPTVLPAYVDFVVLVRYKGDVIPVTTITQSNS